MSETVNHPPHYGGGDNPYEAIKVIEAWGLGFHLGNAVKYLSRSGKKGDLVEDLRKAIWYIQREIDKVGSEQSIHPIIVPVKTTFGNRGPFPTYCLYTEVPEKGRVISFKQYPLRGGAEFYRRGLCYIGLSKDRTSLYDNHVFIYGIGEGGAVGAVVPDTKEEMERTYWWYQE